MDTDAIELKPKNIFVNPHFSEFICNKNSAQVFDGLITIGNQQDVSYVLSTKVFRSKDTIYFYGELFVIISKNHNLNYLTSLKFARTKICAQQGSWQFFVKKLTGGCANALFLCSPYF